jgi:hypothetical protein
MQHDHKASVCLQVLFVLSNRFNLRTTQQHGAAPVRELSDCTIVVVGHNHDVHALAQARSTVSAEIRLLLTGYCTALGSAAFYQVMASSTASVR